jgi:hypothetical protein
MRIASHVMAWGVLCFAPLPAFAQNAEPKAGKGEMRAACSADVQKFCASTERGKGQVRNCLEGHKAELSDACKAAMAARAKD